MEDSVGVEERREQSEATPHKKARQGVVDAGGEEGGFLSAMTSKIGATMSGGPTNGTGGEAVGATVVSDREAGKRDGSGEPGEEGGFLSAMASKIGAAMSGANGGSSDDRGGGDGGNAAVASGGVDKEADGNGGGGIFRKLLHGLPPAPSQASGAMESEEVKDQAAVAGEQGGILSAMATKIGMSMSGANGDDSHGGSGGDAKTSNGEAARGDHGEEKNREEANGGGILSVVASKIGVAVSGANGNGNAKTSTGDDAGHGSKGEEKGHGVNGGRIVEQIISNLPIDDQAPDADEASLLIAIIED